MTCGTDLKVYRRGYHAKMIVPPALFGHEFAGVIEETGPGVKNFKAGQRVVALNSAPCGQCFYCARGERNLCENRQVLGVSPGPFGSETSGGIRGVRIEHCKFTSARTFALYIKSRPGRGAFIEDITVDDVTAASSEPVCIAA